MSGYLGGFILGYSQFSGYSFVSGKFNKFTLKGGDSQFDNFKVLNYEVDDEYIANATIGSVPVWTPETLALMTFDGNLSSGNITNITSPITNWVIFRRKSTESTFTLLDTIPASQTQYVDTTALPNVTYNYTIVAINATERSTPIDGQITTDFNGWYLIDEESLTAILFDINLEFGGYNTEEAYQRYDGYNKYSAHSLGQRDFRTGTISAIIQEDLCTPNGIIQTSEFVKQVQELLKNGKSKILKSRKGEIMRVFTHNVVITPLNNSILAQPYSISFDFEEDGDVDG